MTAVAGNNITTVSWYCTTTGSSRPMKVYVKETATAPFTAVTWATMTTGATLVYDAAYAYDLAELHLFLPPISTAGKIS
ncbi:MAG: hypothetical protein IPI95_15130 [Flavobacteriales bacterium]|nr:hypothetical protein [Flavobacteriales bacterium]